VYDYNKFPFEKVENGDSKVKIPKGKSDLINGITFEFNGNKYNISELINNHGEQLSVRYYCVM